nr:hypothetical protein [Maliibacterium massiliense]
MVQAAQQEAFARAPASDTVTREARDAYARVCRALYAQLRWGRRMVFTYVKAYL